MARVGRRRDRASQSLAIGAYVVLCAMLLSASADAEESAALKLVRSVQALQAKHGSYAPQVLPPLIELGTLYGAGQCEHALEILELALDISHRADGLLNAEQLPIYHTLMNCHLTLDLPGELARAQRYVTLIQETQYGRDDPRLLQAMEEGARRYEEAGLYLSARRLHDKTLELVRSAGGDNDLRLVPALRGMARAYRLEYTFGLALPDVIEPAGRSTSMRSLAAEQVRYDPRGESALEQAVAILRRHPEARAERIDTLVELGDWHQLADQQRSAMNAYREAWRELHSGEVPETDLFQHAKPLLSRARNSVALRRAPLEDPSLRKYTIELGYRVTSSGRVEDVAVVESNAPRDLTQGAISDMRRMPHRPRFENGQPVEESGLQYRRNIYSRVRQASN